MPQSNWPTTDLWPRLRPCAGQPKLSKEWQSPCHQGSAATSELKARRFLTSASLLEEADDIAQADRDDAVSACATVLELFIGERLELRSVRIELSA